MQYKNELTIELPPFQMEILKRAARFKQESPEEWVVRQLNLGYMESWFDTLIRDAAQGALGEVSMIRCERCQVQKLLGKGATLCATCQYDFPEPCTDEVHQQFASFSESDDNTNFHCATCNKWIVREDHAISKHSELQGSQYVKHLQRQYVVPIGEATFDYLQLFVDEVIANSDPEFARRVTVCMVKEHSSINGLNGLEVDDLRIRLETFLEGCGDRVFPDDPQDRLFLTCFITAASRVVDDIKQAVCEQSKIGEVASS